MNRILILLCVLAFGSCKQETVDLASLDKFSHTQQIAWNKTLTNVMVADIFTPPVCSRIYAYPHIAAYEVLAINNDAYPSLAGTLSELTVIPAPPEGQTIYFPLASIVAYATAAKPLVYTPEKLDDAESTYFQSIKDQGISEKIFEQSVAYGRVAGEHIVKWSAKDGYLERSAMSQYVLSEEAGAWKPTPPDYMPAIEPNWNTLRPFVLKSADQFSPGTPTGFSIKKSTKFYQEALEVMRTTRENDEQTMAIAKFWDCNPNISHTKGHLMFFDQKISPGGHWMSIAGIAAKKKGLSIEETARVFALTSITLADGFISCWDEKYRSSLIRPETYINEHIDPDWKPVLQTPAFPEHTSGHSVISAAAATMLTHLIGDNFAFNDISEVDYGLPSREFTSFKAAAEEAAISRLYGGIHYRPAIEHGLEQGTAIGNYMVQALEK